VDDGIRTRGLQGHSLANGVFRAVHRASAIRLSRRISPNLGEDLKIPRDVVSLILGHTPLGPVASRIYDRAQMLSERRDALTRWAAWIDHLSCGGVGMPVPRTARRAATKLVPRR
jgi:hypothetical protein